VIAAEQALHAVSLFAGGAVMPCWNMLREAHRGARAQLFAGCVDAPRSFRARPDSNPLENDHRDER